MSLGRFTQLSSLTVLLISRFVQPYYLLPFYIDHILRRDLPPGLKRLRIDLRHFSPFVLNLSLTDPITIPVAEWMELDQVIRYTGALCRHLEPIVISLPEAKPGITKAWTSALPGLLPTSTKAALYTVPQIIGTWDLIRHRSWC